MPGNQQKIGIFTLAMINVAAIATLKNLPMMAEYGLSLIFFYALAAIVFFIPSALVSAELATGWPRTGGVYIWVREALGTRWGFVAIWMQWIDNVVWYPTILSFLAGAVAYIVNPELASNKFYTLAVVLVTFWGATMFNFLGMRASGLISSVGVIAGTIVPGAMIIILGIYYVASGGETQIALTTDALIPDLGNINHLILLTGVMLSLMGMEMSAVHAQEVENPQRDYPKAILLAALIILVVMIAGSLAIAIVVPHSEISLVAGVMEAFSVFFHKYDLDWMTPIVAALIAVGAFGTVSTWIVGPTKGLLATAKAGDLPPFFAAMNKNRMPVHLMVVQGFIVTILSFVFLAMPTVSMGYLVLTALSSQVYLVMYVLMFIAAIKLRYKCPDVPRTYRVPAGKLGMWLVAGVGAIASLFTIIFGFFPPTSLTALSQILTYVGILAVGMITVLIAPLVIHHFRRDEWAVNLDD